MVPRPPAGRIFETSRRVRVADADHDVDVPWVVRRTEVAVAGWPRLGERLAISTWCGGTGSRWAERRVTFAGRSGVVDTATLVVHLDPAGRPARLPAWFDTTYASSAMGRVLSSRRTLPGVAAHAAARPWPVRFTDLDVMGHVNNAVIWAAVEDECARLGVAVAGATVEWLGPLEATDAIELRSAPGDDGLGLWLTVDGTVRVAARVQSSDLVATSGALHR